MGGGGGREGVLVQHSIIVQCCELRSHIDICVSVYLISCMGFLLMQTI